jgi:hypothetical protein
MALSRHHDRADPCPLSGVERTLRGRAPMSAFDAERIFPVARTDLARFMACYRMSGARQSGPPP